MTGKAASPRKAQVYSGPTMQRSAMTRPKARAFWYPESNSASVLTLLIPMLDPSEIGFTMRGKPNRAAAGRASSDASGT